MRDDEVQWVKVLFLREIISKQPSKLESEAVSLSWNRSLALKSEEKPSLLF